MTNGLQSSDREFYGLMIQLLAALASPAPSLTTAQLRHGKSERGTFLAQVAMQQAQIDDSPQFSC